MNSQDAFGMAMQISNNPEYLKAISNYSLTSNSDYLSVEIRVNNYASTIEAYASDKNLKINPYKISFLVKSLMLGKIDGGESSMNYINNNIINKDMYITEYDVMLSRLKKIFPADSMVFSKESLKDLKNLYGDDDSLIESYIVRISYIIEMIYSNLYKKHSNDDKLNTAIISLAKKIGELYKLNKKLSIPQDINNLINDAVKSIPDLPDEMKKEIDVLLSQYNSGQLNKDSFIKNISNMHLFEKKK